MATLSAHTDVLWDKFVHDVHSCTASTCTLSRQVSHASSFGEAWESVFPEHGRFQHANEQGSHEIVSPKDSADAPRSSQQNLDLDHVRLQPQPKVPFAQKLSEARLHKSDGPWSFTVLAEPLRETQAPRNLEKVPFAQKRFIARMLDPIEEIEFETSVAGFTDHTETRPTPVALSPAGRVSDGKSEMKGCFSEARFVARLHEMEGAELAQLHPACML
eukprot:TRINITY_DN51458_c0_g1_i1.p1 TRINITY_DN51458_c0_g1~~TRINITY_DN51458_c0_g1_i1.p1  ORF type:complete len:238 (+),score=27.96 TRINITY_DN51458_c0_g1_i1:66-716(+)